LQLKALGKELAVAKVDPTRGNLIVISGPGGVGKSTITNQLRSDPRFWISVSATTREPRPGERDGIDYFFYSHERFQELIDSGEFLEWAEFAGNRYGTPRTPVDEWRTLGKHVILEIEIAGARQVRLSEPGATLIFISPPSWDELVRRLAGRGTDSPERRAARLALAEQEMAAAAEFDAVLVNEKVDLLIAELVSLATA
jgi:guanylate kinase